MSEDARVESITERVTLDLFDHLNDLDKYGRTYIQQYVESIIGKPTTRRPKYRFHPKLAEFVRELAQDAAMGDRRTCGVASSSLSTRDGRVATESPRRKAA
jgi:hypothetical protein